MPWFDDRARFDGLLERIFEDSKALSAHGELHTADIPAAIQEMLVSRCGDALEFLNGRKWGYHVVSALFMAPGPLGFNELAGMIDGVSNRALSTRLKEVVQMGMVDRHADSGPPMRTHYELTEHGRKVATLLTPLVYYMHQQEGIHDMTPEELLSGLG